MVKWVQRSGHSPLLPNLKQLDMISRSDVAISSEEKIARKKFLVD